MRLLLVGLNALERRLETLEQAIRTP